ncbi:MAG: NAD-dependent succinate-semialdehyde dehydrogenase, partial [Pseudomonadota bacterium]|nr:NAD-dependent succinate-semialdehyde dehydrogenase [Pseudomonadota bacterium]
HAHAAGPAWRALPVQVRAAHLMAWHALILKESEALAALLSAEQGKPLAEARGEVLHGAAYLHWFAEEARRIQGDVLPPPVGGKRMLVTKEPIGVVGAITPWNYPNSMVTRKCAPALAAGCTMVLKPAESTPLSALALAALAEQAGLPSGVLNVVTGDPKAIGTMLATHPLVRKLSFTGSTAVGKLLSQQAAGTVKRLSLELGGNAPFIVFDDADVERAVDGVLRAKFRNAGQACISPNRLFVQARVHDAFCARLAEKSSALQVGRACEPGVAMGPLIHEQALARVAALVDGAVAEGARVLTGGLRLPLDGPFYAPTVLVDVRQDMRISATEVFGPVAPVCRFETEQQVLTWANDTPYGLAAYVYTADMRRIFRMLDALECGMVAINDTAMSNEGAPFGGVKESGFGREGSSYGLDDYLVLKYACIGGLD